MFWGMNNVVKGKCSVHCETRERVKAIRKGKIKERIGNAEVDNRFLKFGLFSGFSLATSKK
jgi:hypothetical protein